MLRFVIACALCVFTAFGQYKAETIAGPPDEAAKLASVLQKEGVKITDGSGKTVAEIWMRSTVPSGKAQENASLAIAHGALVGVARFPANFQDRRGQTIKPGVYTLRYSVYPVDGSHQGVAPQRDFLILVRMADDPGADEAPAFEPLMVLARKASGTPHPLSLSAWKADGGTMGIAQEGESDWVVTTKIGDTPISIIVIGVFAG